jgi:hypothetical protein
MPAPNSYECRDRSVQEQQDDGPRPSLLLGPVILIFLGYLAVGFAIYLAMVRQPPYSFCLHLIHPSDSG